MRPIGYDHDCKACHPLTFDAAVKGTDGKPFALPHGKPLADVESLLEFEYGRAIRQDPAAFRRPTASRPLPGQAPGEVAEKPDPSVKASAATRYLEGKAGCGECHTIAGNSIVPVNIPPVWFSHAKFSHAAHTTMKCADCHGKSADSTVNTDILLPDANTCKSCHGPARTEGGKQIGGVRSECTTCHTYHHGPESNPGAAAMRGRDLEFADLRRLMRK